MGASLGFGSVFVDARHVALIEAAMALNRVANVPGDAGDRGVFPDNLQGFGFVFGFVEFLAKLVQLSVHDLQYLVWIFQYFHIVLPCFISHSCSPLLL